MTINEFITELKKHKVDFNKDLAVAFNEENAEDFHIEEGDYNVFLVRSGWGEKIVHHFMNSEEQDKDKIFLLSVEEYKKYKDKIPHINTWWWLRSSGYLPINAANVLYDGSIGYYGRDISNYSGAVRPALNINKNYPIGTRIIVADSSWIVIDNKLAIAEVPIDFRRFNKDDNNYEKSEIRQFLFDWLESRINK